MSQEPKIVFSHHNYDAERKARLKRKIALANMVFVMTDKFYHEDKGFDETQHPRGTDGRFTKSPQLDTPKISDKGGLLPPLVDSEDQLTERDIKETKPKTPCGKVDGISTCGSVFSLVLKNGQKLSIYDDDQNQLSPEIKKEMLRQLADLHDMYPKKKFKTTKILLKNEDGVANLLGNGHNTVGGWVAAKFLPAVGSQSRINVNAANIAFRTSFRMAPDWHMPQGEVKSYARYLISHEFGHQFDIDKNRDLGGLRWNYKATQSLFDNPSIHSSLSKYGQSDIGEGYAEAFAEWHLSRGKTKNPAAIAYARHQKWNPFNVRSSGFDESVLDFAAANFVDDSEDSVASLKPGEFLIIEDEDNGPSIIGERSEVPEPTSEEKQRADDIIREVFKELGLPYSE